MLQTTESSRIPLTTQAVVWEYQRMTEREQQLIGLMREHGYRAEIDGERVRLHVLPIGRWTSGYELPYQFRSVQGAADHLCPIIRDEAFTATVAT